MGKREELRLEELDEEIIRMILDKLLSEDAVAVKSLTQTCKTLHQIESSHRKSALLLRGDLLPCVLKRYPNLTHLDFSFCPSLPQSFLATLPCQLSSLNLARSRFPSLTALIAACPNLVDLDLSHATDLTDSAASAIAGARNLERLTLVRCKVLSDMGIGCIAVGCKKLKRVSLKWCLQVSDLGVALLALKCPLLLSLDLSFLPITEKCLGPILKLQHLQELVLVGCLGLDDDGLASLEDGCSSLTTLDLSNCQNISHTGLANLTKDATFLKQITLAYGSANFSGLQCLKLDGCLLTSSALRTIGSWPGSLTELSLSKCSGVTDEGVSSIVRRHTELRKLDITCCRKVTSVSLDCITSSCTALNSLKMEACSLVSKEAFPLIGQRCRYLEELDVTDDHLDDEGLKSLFTCWRLSSLKLGICKNITDEGLIQIGMHCSRLKEIDLYRATTITDTSIKSLAKGCPSLEFINIAYCDKVTDSSLVSLSECSRLKVLEARGCSCITSEGLAAIAAGCRQLLILDVKKCFKINNSGMIPLAHYSQNLKQVNLSYCSVTDLGLLALASISRLQNMTILHLAGLSLNGLAAALLACRGLKKVKLHTSFKSLLPQSFIDHLERGGCVFHWRDKAFQPQVDTDPLNWNLQFGRPS